MFHSGLSSADLGCPTPPSHLLQFDPRRLAAVVYDEGVAVDLLLEVFAQDLRERGVRVGGVLHVPRGEAGCGPDRPIQLHDLRTGQIASLCHKTDRGRIGCAIDPAALPAAAQSVRVALDEHAEIVFFSRFGKQEVHGRGFRDEMTHGALRSCVVLTAVRRGLIDDWFGFTGGVGTLLEARLSVLNAWWAELDLTRSQANASRGHVYLTSATSEHISAK